jgi:hypothetical protein
MRRSSDYGRCDWCASTYSWLPPSVALTLVGPRLPETGRWRICGECHLKLLNLIARCQSHLEVYKPADA